MTNTGQAAYIPTIGETVFVSLSGNPPLLITVTGFRYHDYLKESLIFFTRLDGSESWARFETCRFFTEVPNSQPYIYFVTSLVENGYDGLQWAQDEEWFFTPEAAFKYATEEDHIVEIRKVI